jgi:hypothetical protein
MLVSLPKILLPPNNPGGLSVTLSSKVLVYSPAESAELQSPLSPSVCQRSQRLFVLLPTAWNDLSSLHPSVALYPSDLKKWPHDLYASRTGP